MQRIGEPMTQAMIKPGAMAYSPDGTREWGEVPKDISNEPVTVVGDVGDKRIVDSPRWSNGKRWSVKKTDSTLIPDNGGGDPPTQPPPQPPEPPIEYASFTRFYTDGTPPNTIILVPLISGE